MKATRRLRELLGLRCKGYPCRCGGELSHVEYHSTKLCTDSALQFAGVWDTRNALPESKQWTKDELPLDD